MSFFGLQRKNATVKTGNLSTQAVETAESEQNSKVLKNTTTKKGVRTRIARRRENRNSSSSTRQQTGTVTVRQAGTPDAGPIANKPLERVRNYVVGPAPLVIESPVQTTDASTTSTNNSSLNKPASLRYSDDLLDMSETTVVNNQFEPVEKNGISVYRPEVICISNFAPVYSKDLSNLTSAGKLISLQQQMLTVRKETLSRTLSSVDKWDSTKSQVVFDNLKKSFEKELQRTHRTIEHYDQFINALEVSKENLDIRNVRYSQGINIFTLSNFFEKNLQFSKTRQTLFSNTKLYLQMCSDLRAILENYSFGLLNLSDSDRTNDVNPIDIDNTYTIKDGFTFSIDSIRSTVSPENASNSVVFNKTMNSLPQDPSDRIKLLITLLSKEYRVSKNLAVPATAKILIDKFSQTDTGNPFDNVVGIPGDTIFDSPVGIGSLSSIAQVSLGENAIVLPFERKYVDAETKGKTYIPGSSYFFDTVVAGATAQQFNTKPFVDYVDLATNTTNDSIGTIKSLLDLDLKKGEVSRVSPNVMINSFLSSIRNSIEGIVTTKIINKDQAASVALFKLANSDSKLKNMLFQFAIFAGIATQTKEDNKQVFGRLAKELKTSSAISYARIIARLSIDLTDTTKLGILQSYLQDLAQDIEDRVFLLVAGREIPKRSTATQTSQQFGLDNSYSSIDTLGTVDFNPDRRTLFLNEGDIKTILMSLMVPGTRAVTSLMREFLNLSNELAAGASVNGIATFLIPDESGRTRYNFLSTSMQLLLVFEILSSLSMKYTFSEFGKSRYQNKIVLDIDVKSNNYMVGAISQAIRSNPEVVDTTPKTPTSNPSAKQNQAFVASWNSMIQYAKTGIMPQQSGVATITKGPTATPANVAPVIQQTPPGPELLELKNSLLLIITKIKDENKVIVDFLSLFNQIVSQLRNAKTILLNTFNSSTLQSFLQENSTVDLAIIKNPTQVRTSSFLLSELLNSSTPNTTENSKSDTSSYDSLVVTDTPTEQQLKLMMALLKEPQYGFSTQADERLRILSVGIPAGLSQKLSERLNLTKINKESFIRRQSDVIKINVYKRDARFDDIVFKPKTFLFDLSLFQSLQQVNNIEPRDGETFDLLLNRVNLTDYQNPKHKRLIGTSTIEQDDSYNFLTSSQKQDLIKNHIQSYLLETYLMLVSNMKLREQTFTEVDLPSPGTNINAELVSLIRTYVQDVYGQNLGNSTIESILESQTVDFGVQDIIRLITFGSLLFEPSTMRQQVVGSKLFDRVFHLPVTTENFEVDFDLTRATESGRKAIVQNFIQQRLVETSDNKLMFSNQSLDTAQADVVFADFFVTIETDF